MSVGETRVEWMVEASMGEWMVEASIEEWMVEAHMEEWMWWNPWLSRWLARAQRTAGGS